MRQLLSLNFLFLSVSLLGQIPHPTLLSLKTIGGDGGAIVVTPVTKTSDGGFVTGIYSNAIPGTGDIADYCSTTGKRYLYLKYNADASVLEWSKCFTLGPYIFPQADGSFLFGSVTDTAPARWAYQITKTTASGSVVWIKTYGGQGASAGLTSMIATADGCYIMGGATNYTDTDFTIHYGSWMDADFAIIKVDRNGNKIWSRVIGGTAYDIIRSLVATSDGGCYIVGHTSSNDSDCTGNHGSTDAYVARLDRNGAILWHRDLGGTADDAALFATCNGKNGIIIAAKTFSSNGDVSHYFPDPTGSGSTIRIWAIEIDNNGHTVWDNCYGGNCTPNSICRAADGSIWIAGMSSYVKFGQVDTVYGREDAWFVHADSAGNFLNEQVLGSDKSDEGFMVYPLANGNVIAGGGFETFTGSFAPITLPRGIGAFLAVFSPITQTAISDNYPNNKIRIYPNPVNGLLRVAGKEKLNYKIVIYDWGGRAMYNGEFSGREQLQVAGWQAGMYYVRVQSEEGHMDVQKFVIVR